MLLPDSDSSRYGSGIKPHLKQQWVIAPDASAAFVANMEDVLEVYQRARVPERPLVCLDETSKQMIVETRATIPAKPGRKARHDYEYARNGVANLFMMLAHLEGWRHVKLTDRHTAIDYAHALRDLSDMHFPDATKIVLVQDNLSTHKPASLYQAFPASEARRLVERFEWHYTPKHGSWLDMAESELGVLARGGVAISPLTRGTAAFVAYVDRRPDCLRPPTDRLLELFGRDRPFPVTLGISRPRRHPGAALAAALDLKYPSRGRTPRR